MVDTDYGNQINELKKENKQLKEINKHLEDEANQRYETIRKLERQLADKETEAFRLKVAFEELVKALKE